MESLGGLVWQQLRLDKTDTELGDPGEYGETEAARTGDRVSVLCGTDIYKISGARSSNYGNT